MDISCWGASPLSTWENLILKPTVESPQLRWDNQTQTVRGSASEGGLDKLEKREKGKGEKRTIKRKQYERSPSEDAQICFGTSIRILFTVQSNF